MTTSTEGPVQIVLGATGGIGGALVERLAAKGNRLVLGAGYGENVGCRTADVNTHRFDSVLLFDGLNNQTHRARSRHDRCVGPRHQFLVSRRLCHHVFHE